MPSLFDLTTSELRKDVVRVVGVSLQVPDDETCRRASAEYGETWRPKANVVIELEPVSYRLATDDTPADETLHTYVRLALTYSSEERGLSVAELASIREQGFYGIPKKKMIQLDRGLIETEDKDLWMPYQRWSKKAALAGFVLDVDANTGQFSTPNVGDLFDTESGSDRFYGGSRSQFITYLVGKTSADYVALPVNERPTVVITRREAATDDEAVTNVPAGSQVVDGPRLISAFEAAGVYGKSVKSLSDATAQQALVARSMRLDPVFANKVITDAADNGDLIVLAVELGAATISDEGTIERA